MVAEWITKDLKKLGEVRDSNKSRIVSLGLKGFNLKVLCDDGRSPVFLMILSGLCRQSIPSTYDEFLSVWQAMINEKLMHAKVAACPAEWEQLKPTQAQYLTWTNALVEFANEFAVRFQKVR